MMRFAMGVLNPISEEVLFRGVVVFLLGTLLESFVVSVLLGALVNMTNHLYHGWSVVVSHLLFYAAVTAVLFSPLGLIGAIGFHVGADVVPLLVLRRQMTAWVSRHRRPAAPPASTQKAASSHRAGTA